jgi:cytidine deaminase
MSRAADRQLITAEAPSMVDFSAVNWTELIAAARDAREHSYSPYSHFRVGAAVLLEDGSISAGSNVENRTYGLTLCAERVAIAAAVARGARRAQAIAVVTETSPPAAPCGLCLQTMAEFAGPELPILLVNVDGERVEHKLRDLLPHPFEVPGT